MDSSDNIKLQELAKQVIEAAKTALEPNVSYEQRLFAYEFLEKTKDDTNLAIPCGFFLSGCDKDPQVRHLGLQFLEDAIRYHWNDIPLVKKVFIKENSMLLLASGTQDILLEPMYVKDKISRLIVEMIKREWPQQWPGLLKELESLANMGPTQAELVLLIFLRIAEDVATLQNLESNQRRRDLYQTLNQNMDFIFCLFFNLLEHHYTKYTENSSENSNLKHCRITQAVFSTLTCYMEWVSIYCIQNHQSKLFNSICQLISDQNIRQNAVECLLQIVSRKGKPEERKFILSLFTEDVMKSVSNAANLAVMDPLNEKNYLFLKGLTQVVTTLGSQLSCLWGKEPGVKEPQCFPVYLNTLLAFSKHPSLTIFSYTNLLWAQFFRNEVIGKNAALIYIIPQWLPVAYSKVMKQGFPSKGDSVTCEYSNRDFDSDEEYHLFFCKVRSETCEAIKLATLISPVLLFTFVEEQFKNCLQKDLTPESLQCLQINWDALSHVVERIMSQLIRERKGFKVPKERVKFLFRQCFQYEAANPDILSLLLTCISGLCALLPFIPEVLEDVLNKLFECISYTGGQTKENRTKAVKNARKHAASLLLRLCRIFPRIFLEAFNRIDHRVVTLIQSNELSQLERVTLVQSLLILNSHINNYRTQQDYIGKLINSSKEDWLGLKDVLYSPSSLMTFIGLNKPTTDSQEVELYGSNRSKIFSCIDLIQALLNRCKIPSEGKTAEEGGFVLTQSKEGIVYRNPATPHILSLLPNVFCFLRAYNGLYLPESMAQVPRSYAKVHTIPEEEKISLLGMRNPMATQLDAEVSKTVFQRMQIFLRTVHEHLCLILGYCGPNLRLEFYQYPHLAECLIHSVFWNFTLLPNLKMRFAVRILKPFIEASPKQLHESVILPLIYHVSPIMMTELQLRWEHISEVKENETYDEDNVDTDELVDNMMLHAMTRDYLEAIGALLTERSSAGNGRESHQLEANGDFSEEMETNEADFKPQTLQQEIISPLGKLALRCDPICQSIVLTLLRALSWSDTVSCRKSIQPLFLCVQEMMEEGHQHLNEEAVKQIFMCVLAGIHIHGQHKGDLEALSDLAVSLYEKLRPHFPALRQVLLMLPDANIRHIVEFEDLLRKIPEGSVKKMNKQNKFKREAFKKVVHNIIGRSVGEALKKDVQFSDLKPIFRQRRHEQPHLDETNDDLNLCSLFGTAVAE